MPALKPFGSCMNPVFATFSTLLQACYFNMGRAPTSVGALGVVCIIVIVNIKLILILILNYVFMSVNGKV